MHRASQTGEKLFIYYALKCCYVSGLINGGVVEYHREKERAFNEYEGIMRSDFSEIAEILCKFSPSALNTYLKCPFKYLASYLYKLGAEEEEEGEFSNLEIGDFYHKVLYGYYSTVNQYLDFEERQFKKVFEEVYSKLRLLDISEEDREIDREDYYETLRNFIVLDIERLQKFEKQTKGNVLRPLLLESIVEDSTIFGVYIKCKIDRVDAEYRVHGDKLIPTGRYVIYDYKKKSISGINEILENKDCQLALYNFLIEEELKTKLDVENLECMALLYLSIEKSESKIELDGICQMNFNTA